MSGPRLLCRLTVRQGQEYRARSKLPQGRQRSRWCDPRHLELWAPRHRSPHQARTAASGSRDDAAPAKRYTLPNGGNAQITAAGALQVSRSMRRPGRPARATPLRRAFAAPLGPRSLLSPPREGVLRGCQKNRPQSWLHHKVPISSGADALPRSGASRAGRPSVRRWGVCRACAAPPGPRSRLARTGRRFPGLVACFERGEAEGVRFGPFFLDLHGTHP